MHKGNEAQRSIQSRRRRTHELQRYYSLEKRLADPEALALLWSCSEAFSDSDSCFYHHTAGWTMAESALIAKDLASEERHALLDMGEWEWQTAHDIQLSKDETEARPAYQHFLKSPELIRIEASQAVGEVFRGMIDGDITPEIRRSSYEKLLELAVRASDGTLSFTDQDGYQERIGESYIGIAHELNALLTVNRLQSPTFMAFPALARSDSGRNFPRQTHDLALFDMKWGQINKVLPVEVKTTPNDDHFSRYDAIIIGGTMHLHPQNLRDPAFLTELLVKEYKDLLSDTELQMLDTITDNTFHAARHGFADIPQCRDNKSCIDIPASRHDHLQHV